MELARAHVEPAIHQRTADVESVVIGESGVTFRIRWGDHLDQCDVGPHGSEGGHSPVVEIDYDNADHRRVLRWFRKLDPEHNLLFAVPHPGTLVHRTDHTHQFDHSIEE